MLFVPLAIGVTTDPAIAGTTTGSATIQVIMASVCELVSVPSLDFGEVGSVGALGADIDTSGTFSISCAADRDYTIYLGDGANRAAAGSGLRNMASGTALLPYQLFKDEAHSAVWDETGIGAGVTGGAGGVDGTGSGASQLLTIYGQIPIGTTLPKTLGAYADTVLVTVAY
jgi:spore coat protein U-like protein